MRTLRALLLTLVPASLALAQTITTASLPNGVLNGNYNAQLSCNNCQGYSYTLVGSLPPSLSLSPGGSISGITNAIGTYTFNVGLTLPGNATIFGERTLSINVPSGLTILSTTFPNGTVGVAYSQTLSASGGVPPYTWSISGNSPPGLGIANNTFLGTPTTTGTFTFNITATDSAGNGAFVQPTIVISAGSTATTITTTTLPVGVVNTAYNAQFTCINCTGYTWSQNGLLPLGLTLNSAGAISGTPTTAGSSSFQIILSPPPGSTNSPITQVYILTVNASALSITTSTLPIAFAGTPYSYTLAATGGLTPYTWSLTSPLSANDGISINANTGTLVGTPTANGTFILAVQLADSSGLTVSKQFTLSVSTSLSILTTSLPNGSVGQVYPTQTLSAGGGQPPYRWAVTTGTLPAGLTLDGVFGRISGTPTANGTSTFTLTVTDNQANTATAKLSITVGSGVTITITPATLPGGSVGTAYAQTLSASGGAAPYTWSVVSTATAATGLPPGLGINPTSGAIVGTPTTAGTYSFTVQATDSNQATGQAALSITITAGAPLSITTASFPNATVGTAYSQSLAATGGTAPYTWALSSGTLPAGLTLNASTGAITGTPTAASTTSFTVQVTDSAKNTQTKNLGIVVVTSTPPLTITTTTLPAGTTGTAYSQTVAATGGTAPYKYALSSNSNNGLTINATTGAITGTPTATGTFTLTVVVTDSSSPAQTATQNLTLTVSGPAVTITIAPSTLPAATVGTAYSQTLTASGGASPYKFAVTTGVLPSGITLSATGAISGTSSALSSSIFTVTATDSNNATGTKQYTLIVAAATAPTITLAGIPNTQVGFQQQLALTPTISATYPSTVGGAVTLTFTPSVTPPAGSTGTIDDSMIQFSGGGRTANFTIPAGSTTAPSITVLTGTTAGTITLTTALSANGLPLGTPTTQTIINAPGVPFISKVTLTQAAGGVTVTITGFSSTRDMVNASFAFAPATGDTFTSDNVSVPVQTAFNTWWSTPATSNQYGTEFTLTVPFTLATATQSVTGVAVVSVTVTLQNSKGASNSVTLSQ